MESGHGDILKLGLIHGTLNAEEASTEEQPKWLTYAHKLFHDCLAGYHVSRKVFHCWKLAKDFYLFTGKNYFLQIVYIFTARNEVTAR